MNEENKKPENPFAFPINMEKCYDKYKGMTLRDYFAAKAMQAFIANKSYQNGAKNLGIEENIRQLSEASYDIANGMLKQREQ